MLIYTAVFAIVLAISVDLFFRSKILETQVAENQEVDRNGRTAFLEMTQTIRGAASVSSPALGASAAELYLNNNDIRYFVNGNGLLQKTEGGQTSDLTANSVTVQNLLFTTRGEAGQQPTVSVLFEIKANTLVYGQTSYISKTYQTTIQLR